MYGRAACRWHVRFLQEVPNIDLRENQAVLALLAGDPCQSARCCGLRRTPQSPALVRTDR
jgi:hypothetical protein